MSDTRNNSEIFGQENNQPAEVKRKIEELKSREPMKVQDVSYDPLGLDIPTEICPLPSEGKLYPPGHPLHNQTTVEIHPMTAREEDILTTRAYLKKGTVITELIRSSIVNKRIDPDDLVSGDKSALMVAIRITGYGSEYDAEIKCGECEETYKHTFDLSALEIRTLGAEPKTQGSNEFEFLLPMTKKRVVFKFLNGHDENEIKEHEDKRKKLNISKNDNAITRNLFQTIVSIDSITDRAKISKFINNMPARDSMALRNYMSDIAPTINMDQEVKCKHCGHIEKVSMPVTTEFFWPNARK